MRLPPHWRLLKWGDLATLEYGKALCSYRGVEGPYPVFGTNGQIGWHEEYLCPHSGVVVGRKGAYRGIHFSSKPFFVIDTAFYLSPLDRTAFDIKWAYYQLLDFDINKVDSGSAIPSTSRAAFYEIPVLLPPVEVQRKIAGVLSTYDDLIENNLRRIQILEGMAQALYREWFVELRFPAHQVKAANGTPKQLPDGWRVTPLGHVASVNEISLKPKTAPEEIVYVAISGVSTGRVDERVPMAFSDAPGRARRVVRHGDTIWSTVRPNLKSYSLILDPDPNLIVSTGFAVLSPKSVPFTYLYHAVTNEAFVGYLVNHAKGSAYPAVSQDDFRSAKLTVPPDDLLQRFHEVVEPMTLLADVLLRRNDVLRRSRDLLLPRLIAGELDTSELDIYVGEVA